MTGNHPGRVEPSCLRRGEGDRRRYAKAAGGMHLDTVFTFADRDVVTIYPEIVDSMPRVHAGAG